MKPMVVADPKVIDNINNNVFKPRKHPGIMEPKTVLIPDTLVKSVINAIEDYPVKALLANGEILVRHLKGRNPPMEKEQLRQTAEKFSEKYCPNLRMSSLIQKVMKRGLIKW
ncbi:hypothetical protein NQ318_021977 [Aromia moschata]|uniref:Uncharacterized protein n=1 Tax=Aromia moschata TaxID=1265417 RepID=A0AAV8Z744_9CUCU|nr:hypothetical protein NQ318_021977 [Aromia moschata]